MVRLLPAVIIVKRELITSLRRVRTVMLVVGLFGVEAISLLLSWPTHNLPTSAVANVTESLVNSLSYLLFLGCILCVPGLAAATIVSEREQDTLDQLYLTLVRPSGVIAAKALNTAGIYLLLMVATLPIFATVMFGVGTDWRQLIFIFGFLTMTALTCAMIGIVCSTIFRRTFFAVTASYVATVVLMIGGPLYVLRLLRILLTGRFYYLYGQRNPYAGISWSSSFSPLETLSAIQHGALLRLPFAIGAQGAFCLVCFFIAVRLLRRQTEPRVISTEHSIDDPRVLKARRTRFPYYLIDPLRRKPLIDDSRNPMLIREMRWGLFNRGTILVRIFYCVFTIAGFGAMMVVTARIQDVNEAATGWYALLMGIMSIIATVLIANSFAREYELGNIDMLRMTLLNAGSVVRGKGLAGVLSLGPALLAVVLASLPILYWHPRAWPVIGSALLTLCVCVFLCTAMGMAISLVARRTNVAVVGGLVACLLLFVGPLIISEFFRTQFPLRLSLIFGFRENLSDYHPNYPNWRDSLVFHAMLALAMLLYTVYIFRYRRMQDR